MVAYDLGNTENCVGKTGKREIRKATNNGNFQNQHPSFQTLGGTLLK